MTEAAVERTQNINISSSIITLSSFIVLFLSDYIYNGMLLSFVYEGVFIICLGLKEMIPLTLFCSLINSFNSLYNFYGLTLFLYSS
jgi:hypothetical protein